MTAERVARIAAAGETETVEFNSSTGTRHEATMTVSAMLNLQGGLVLFGVSPERRMVGQQVSEHAIEEVCADFARIDPPAVPEIERILVDGGREIIAVSVGHGPAGPCMCRGRAYRRMGSSTVEMRADESLRLLFDRMHSEWRLETQPADGWAVADPDVAEVRNTVAAAVRIDRPNGPGGRDPEDLLRDWCRSAAACCFGRRQWCSEDRAPRERSAAVPAAGITVPGSRPLRVPRQPDV